MNDPEGAVDNVNEIWPSFTTNSDGRGYISVTNNFIARDTAVSIVIHDTPNAESGSGSKFLCADLEEIDDDDDKEDWDDDLEDDAEKYAEDFETDDADESSGDYTCPSADSTYELDDGSHPKKCGVEDSDGNLQPDTSLCKLANNAHTDCACSVNGKYYCVPS